MSNTWIGFNEPRKFRFIGCNLCHRLSGEKGVTLVKGPDSYYCTSCYNVVMLKREKEKENKNG